jgi:hypothetical protein
MPIAFPEDQQPDQVLVKVSGAVSIQEMLSFIAMSRSGEQRDYAFLFDVTAAALTVSGDEMRQLAAFAADQMRQGPMGPVAFISTDPGPFGLSRIFQSYSVAEGRRNVGVFRTLSDARAWIATLPR